MGGVKALAPSVRSACVRPFSAARVSIVVKAEGERLRLNNLGPEEGSRRRNTRKGRGHGAGQGGTCGFGNRGQKARSGPSVRPGFEGGQTPLYRRLPKLRGIAGGMGKGVPDFVVVNLFDLDKNFEAGEEVTLEAVKEKFLSVTGSDTGLPLKVLGTGELTKALTIKAVAFSSSAKAKIEAAGGKAEEISGRVKWTRKAYEKAKKANPNFAEEVKKAKVAKLQAKGRGKKAASA
uniref:Large ribosomal subunit protein uL15/eL18 domain-containing protein n=1 Tax=Chlamydomonas euryale TaxID=1486919 RepID=A0A7R9VGA9_9CHLO